MTAEDHLRSGDVDAALAALQTDIRAKPQDAKLRIFLFQLLCVMGQWQRAVTQVKLAAELDASAIPMAQTYREAIICELMRDKVFAGEKEPLMFGEPADWMARLVEALKLTARGEGEAAMAMRNEAFEAAPAASGMLNGEPFEWIADADMRLGPVLEVILNGRYFWVPFTAISQLRIEEPSDLRDLVWTPCEITFANEGEMVGLIPTRYPGTAEAAPELRLSRTTEWRDLGAETWAGLGQRLLATDAGDTGLLELRQLNVTQPESAATGEGGGEGETPAEAGEHG